MSKEAEEYLKKKWFTNKQGNVDFDYDDKKHEARFDYEVVVKLLDGYAEQHHQTNVRPIQMELERWKYLYQTEFNKNKLKK